MIVPIHFEVFSNGMKARLNPTYRRELALQRERDDAESWKTIDTSQQTTALPFTTKTKAYGTYVGRRH